MSEKPRDSNTLFYTRRHLRFGWWSLLVFLTLGLELEVLHGLKVGWYLDVSNETRRLMWTLAHAHGALLSLVHIAFGLTVHLLPARRAGWRLVSACLMVASVLLPGGFFLGGVIIYDGDPGLGILLVPTIRSSLDFQNVRENGCEKCQSCGDIPESRGLTAVAPGVCRDINSLTNT